jgi:hypothetical protein
MADRYPEIGMSGRFADDEGLTRLALRDLFLKKRWGWLRPATHALRGFPGRALIQDFSRRDLLDAHWTRLAPRTLSLKKTAGMVSQACAWGYRLSPAEAGALMRRLPVPIAVTRQAETKKERMGTSILWRMVS